MTNEYIYIENVLKQLFQDKKITKQQYKSMFGMLKVDYANDCVSNFLHKRDDCLIECLNDNNTYTLNNNTMTNKFLYSSYLVPESIKQLKMLLDDLQIQRLDDEYLHHCTIEFGSDTIITPQQENQYTTIDILGVVVSDKCQAFIVDSCLSKNKNPHITISCKDGIKPFYSNEMLEKNLGDKIMFNYPFEILVRIEKIYAD